MNIENLKEGEIVKNYKELCNLLEIKVTSGKSKNYQLENLSNYVLWEREGNKFVILKIYDIPKEKKVKGNNKYLQSLEKLILHLLSSNQIENNGEVITLPRDKLYATLYLINENYHYGEKNIKRLSQHLEIPITTLYDFYKNTNDKLKSNVKRCLNSLQNRWLIKWEYGTQVHLNDGQVRIANSKEMVSITEIEKRVSKEMNIESIQELYLKNKWKPFYIKVGEELAKETDIIYYEKVFRIYTTDEFQNMILESKDLETVQQAINILMIDSVNNTAEKYHKKIYEKWRGEEKTCLGNPYSESEKVALRPQYVEDTKKIGNTVINKDTKKILLDDKPNTSYLLKDSKNKIGT